MRIIKKKNYYIRGKIPFSQWPDFIHRYLTEQGLKSQKFLYYFMDFMGLNLSGLSKLMKDLPEIGVPREFYEEDSFHKNILTNIDADTGCSEAQFLPLMKKIHRSYGLTECNLYYLDVDFFSDLIPSQRALDVIEKHYKDAGKPVNPLYLIDQQPYGSGFLLHRDINSQNYLSMSVDILHNGIIMDPEPYFSAMDKLLPGIRSSEFLELYPSEEEREAFHQHNQAAQPVIKRCRDWLEEKLRGVDRQNTFSSNYNIAPKLKKLAKRYGFTYLHEGHGIGIYHLENKTENGHRFRLTVDSGPSHYDATFSMTIQGLGFYFILCAARFVPKEQQEFDACADRAAEVADTFRKEMLPLLDVYWPETPDWYIPELYPTIFYQNEREAQEETSRLT